jgi:transcriptional regulator with XRE-family HTH domain
MGQPQRLLVHSRSMNVRAVQTLAQRLRDRRAFCRLTQAELATQSRVPLAALAAMEHGLTSTPYFTDVALLAQVLGVDAHWLYYGEYAAPGER